MRLNTELRMELLRRYGSQLAAAKSMGIHENRMSHFVNGHSIPNAKEWQKLEAALGEERAHQLVKLRVPVQGKK